jgi:hypothetical protein
MRVKPLTAFIILIVLYQPSAAKSPLPGPEYFRSRYGFSLKSGYIFDPGRIVFPAGTGFEGYGFLSDLLNDLYWEHFLKIGIAGAEWVSWVDIPDSFSWTAGITARAEWMHSGYRSVSLSCDPAFLSPDGQYSLTLFAVSRLSQWMTADFSLGGVYRMNGAPYGELKAGWEMEWDKYVGIFLRAECSILPEFQPGGTVFPIVFDMSGNVFFPVSAYGDDRFGFVIALMLPSRNARLPADIFPGLIAGRLPVCLSYAALNETLIARAYYLWKPTLALGLTLECGVLSARIEDGFAEFADISLTAEARIGWFGLKWMLSAILYPESHWGTSLNLSALMN